ncbi:MarR family winged helix-turn-helix transcriptional regulator [Rhodococcus sp. OK302]|uniref:MarR family winged helix-turn-helix transcriptional regulator n=1 Tax=Rhodococcus sp. OK302 TaxID=1882769 RepID=UPI000B93A31D|nr:MarR family winged helix-turn-helix transcriptional regulator [Rhodococcus sp. OK302]OYD71373.1 DNA-binding MarR family transcriptional regulator [Rhodococcus sp. OK302]
MQHTGAKSLIGPPAVHDELVHLTRQLMTGDRQSDDQPSIAQHSFLSFIGRNDGCRATEISDVFGVNRSTISRQVRGCIDAGWVFADPGPVRQGNPLHLTDAGRTYLDAADARRLDQVTSRLQDWSESEIAEFARALHRFRISTESQTNGDENL